MCFNQSIFAKLLIVFPVQFRNVYDELARNESEKQYETILMKGILM